MIINDTLTKVVDAPERAGIELIGDLWGRPLT